MENSIKQVNDLSRELRGAAAASPSFPQFSHHLVVRALTATHTHRAPLLLRPAAAAARVQEKRLPLRAPLSCPG